MKIRTLGWLIGLSGLASSFISCSQAKVVCLVGHAGNAGYAATYTIKGTAPACAAKTTHPSGVTLDQLKGDIIGFETYHPVTAIEDDFTPDFSKTTLAIQVESLGTLAGAREDPDASKDHHPYALGSFVASAPDATNFCAVPSFSAGAEQDFPGVPAMQGAGGGGGGGTEAVPPLSIKNEWKNLKLYVTAAAQGTQFSADLTYTQDGCSVDYHVVGLWPQVDCGNYDEKTGDLTGLNDDACNPLAEPEKGRPTGSGINPDFPVKCTAIREKANALYGTGLAVCALTGGEPPVLIKGAAAQ